MTFPLQDGATYVNGSNERATIGGTCKDFPGWCWSIQGDWYERATGYRITYVTSQARPGRERTGKHEVYKHRTWRDLVALAENAP